MAVAKRLYRIPKEGKLAGVCAGLADYFEIDVTLVRVIFVVLTLATGGLGVPAYILLAIIMPITSNNRAKTAATDIGGNIQTLADEIKNTDRASTLRNVFGISLIALGVWLLIGQFFPDLWILRWSVIWPTILVLAGLLLVTRSRR